jgi:hypothetical protein
MTIGGIIDHMVGHAKLVLLSADGLAGQSGTSTQQRRLTAAAWRRGIGAGNSAAGPAEPGRHWTCNASVHRSRD